MLDLNPQKLESVAVAAFDALAGTKDARRWETAITKAKRQLEENPYMHPQPDGSLLILSPDSSEIYSANGTCQCKAWTRGKFPCWHRAAARLYTRYLETSH